MRAFAKHMLEIETASGWVCIPTQEKPLNSFHGAEAFYIADDPTMPAYQALRQVGGKVASFRLYGRTQKCFVEFNKVPMLLEKQIAQCVLRLTPVK